MWVFCFCFSPFRLKLKVKFPRVTQHASLLILLLHVLGTLLEAPQCSAGCWLSGKGVQQYWTRNKETMWERCTNMNVCPGRIGAPEARLLLCTSNCPFKLSLIHAVPEQCKTAGVLLATTEQATGQAQTIIRVSCLSIGMVASCHTAASSAIAFADTASDSG